MKKLATRFTLDLSDSHAVAETVIQSPCFGFCFVCVKRTRDDTRERFVLGRSRPTEMLQKNRMHQQSAKPGEDATMWSTVAKFLFCRFPVKALITSLFAVKDCFFIHIDGTKSEVRTPKKLSALLICRGGCVLFFFGAGGGGI